MADDAGKREFIQRNVTSDLQYIWDDSEVSLDLQYRFGQRYKSLRVFIAIAENTADIRTALRTDFQVDPNAEVMGLPRNLQHSERLAMLRAVETAVEVLAEHDTPSSEYLALKVEECENGEILASSLDEVTSKAHKTTSSLQTSLDTAGHVRVVKNKTRISAKQHRGIQTVIEVGSNHMVVYGLEVQVETLAFRPQDGSLPKIH